MQLLLAFLSLFSICITHIASADQVADWMADIRQGADGYYLADNARYSSADVLFVHIDHKGIRSQVNHDRIPISQREKNRPLVQIETSPIVQGQPFRAKVTAFSRSHLFAKALEINSGIGRYTDIPADIRKILEFRIPNGLFLKKRIVISFQIDSEKGTSFIMALIKLHGRGRRAF